MKTAVKNTLAVLIALACMTPSMAVNAVHQFTHTPGPLAWPLAGAAVLSVLLAGSSPFAMEAALSQRRFGVFLAALAAFIVCASYNLVSAVGAASAARSDVAGARKADNARAVLLTSQLAAAEKSRAVLAAASGEQTPGMIDNALLALRNDARWARSKECADATLPDSRTFCAEYAQKLAARDAASKVAELDRDITAIKAQLLTTTGTAVGQSADPQADNIANALELVGAPANAGKIGMGLNLWFALTIEVLGSLGPVVFASVLRRRQAPIDLSPVITLKPDIIPADMPQVEYAAPTVELSRGTGEPARPTAKKRVPRQPKATVPRQKRDAKKSSGGNVLPFVKDVSHELSHPPSQDVSRMASEGKSVREIAEATGLSKTTIHRRLQASLAEGENGVSPE